MHHGRFKWHCVAILAPLSELVIGVTGVTSHAQGRPGDSQEADQMFQSLDTNQNGSLEWDEAGPKGRVLLKRIFEMAGKPSSGTVSRAEFQQVFENHRSGARERTNPPATGHR